MELVNSNEEKLPGPVVIARSIGQTETDGHPLPTRLAVVAKETSMERTDIKQFGNTVFLSHKGIEGNKNKKAGRIFNMDVGNNFINNLLQYVSYLQKEGTTHYSALFEGEDFLNSFIYAQRLFKDIDTKINIGKKADGDYIAFIKIGENPLPEGL